jgi:hypothetical protein
MHIITDIEQNTPDWFEMRLGKPSASKASQILTKTGRPSKSQLPYMEELAWEIITGTKEEGYKNDAMQAGNDAESDARTYFELAHGVTITQVGCIFPSEDDHSCLASPDGLILDIEEGFETKLATKRKIQTERLKSREPDNEHWCQMQFSLMVSGWKVWNYQSYHPELPKLHLRIERDEKYISALRVELAVFNKELAKKVEEFRGL